MKEKQAGWILNISSHAALHPAVNAGGGGGTVYGMCKAALERMTTGLASEVYGDGIGVNVISPGLVATPGVMHHNLITEDTPEERVTPVEHMSEACLRLVYGDQKKKRGRGEGWPAETIFIMSTASEFAIFSINGSRIRD